MKTSLRILSTLLVTFLVVSSAMAQSSQDTADRQRQDGVPTGKMT